METAPPESDPSPASGSPVPWWRRAVTYQVYIRSYADANGDGTGDINGLRTRLAYLRDLGVDAIWINPWYRSPLADGGYDVADYRDIEPRYGNLGDAEKLIAEAHEHGIRVIADVVPNHTSEQHVWFAEALASPPGHPSRERYHFRDGAGPDGSQPPNNWLSVFGGPAWTRVDDGQWYLHIFAPEQPDLNWEHPEVRSEFLGVLRFWLDRGIDGFRVDVAHGMIKDPDYVDVPEVQGTLLAATRVANHPFWDRDGIHPIVREWRALLETYEGERMLVAEAWVKDDRLPLYLRSDEYHQSFNFDFLEAPWDPATWAHIIRSGVTAAAEVGSASTWVLANHDVMREVTRYGLPNDTDWRKWPVDGPADLLDPERGVRRARAGALVLLSLPGSAYVYQGEELGLPEVWDLPPEVMDDPVWERSGHTQKGRDGCRVPLPWEPDGPSFGFGDGAPWLPQPADWAGLAASVQAQDPASFHRLYRSAIALRRRWGVADEELELVDLGPGIVAYRRGSGLFCVINMGTAAIDLPAHAEVLLRSDMPIGDDLTLEGDPSGPLPPDATAWLR